MAGSQHPLKLFRLDKEYPALIEGLKSAGNMVRGRGGATKEILGTTLSIRDPKHCVVGRTGFSERFMHEEILQLLAGVHDNERLEKITPRAAELITPLTAYGPRIRGQLRNVEHELTWNRQSRRAVVYVGMSTDLTSIDENTANEMPCTCLWQFFVRDISALTPQGTVPMPALHMHVYMRSWDAVWGLSYDVPSFVAVQMALAKALGMGLGYYVHHAGSLHLYERDWEVEAWQNEGLLDLPWIGKTIEATQTRAKEWLYG